MIKKLCSILLLILCGFIVTLQAEDVKVTMKSGSTITGELKELVATDHVTLIIAGVESVIPMNEVASVEKVGINHITTKEETPELKYGQYQITDTKQYPDSFKLIIGNQEITMVLVRGGWFNMGYDGRHSLSWDSEPVHRVTLSSYYISNQLINYNTAETLLSSKKISKSVKPYPFLNRMDVDQVVSAIRKSSGQNYRLLTEAEWEYVTLMSLTSKIIFGFNEQKDEWCSDRWGKYSSEEQINPQGSMSGKNYVVRHFSFNNDKWKRIQASIHHSAYVRIAISADQIQ